MNRHQSRFRGQSKSEPLHAQDSKISHREFGSAEELLREDAAHLELPPQIEARLKTSLNQQNDSAPQSWWKRWFKG